MNKMNDMQPAGWLGIGVALGAGIGTALGNLAIGIAIGLAIGAAMVAWQTIEHKKKNELDESNRP